MKKFLAVCFAAMLIPFSANAVCTTVERITETEMCFHRGGPVRCVPFSDLRSNNRNSWAQQLTSTFQTIMERRELLTSMVADEEARFNPPHREDFYLGDADGVHHHNSLLDTYLVSRCDIVEVTWDGTQFVVTVRNARRTHTPEGELIQ